MIRRSLVVIDQKEGGTDARERNTFASGGGAQRQQEAPTEEPKNTKASSGIEHLVTFFFGTAGLAGSVYLYQKTTVAPIIIAFILATGVASLVYGFLGGIQGATVNWGTLRVGGSMAALIGVAIGVNYYLQEQSGIVVPASGRYEWQWAGDSWKGYISVESDGTATMQLSQYLPCSGNKRWVPLTTQTGKGKFETVQNGAKMKVSIPVRFITYDPTCTQTTLGDDNVLSGTLDRKSAYAGLIEYRTKSGAPLGDMILVKDYSSGVRN